MKIFITGGTGNIGQYVSKALLEAGHELRLLTRTPDRVAELSGLPGVTPIEGNVLELERLEEGLTGCDAVIHIALGWGNDPYTMLMHDTRATVFMLEAAERHSVKKFIYTSSTAAMGPLDDGMDETRRLVPRTNYGGTKAASEAFLLAFNQYNDAQAVLGRKTGIKRNIIRPGYTFSNPAFENGASQSDKRFRHIAEAAVAGQDIIVSEYDGSQFLSSGQIAQLYLKLAESELDQEIFLALGTQWVSWAEIARLSIALVPGSTSKVVAPEGDAARPIAKYNVSKMERVFGLSFRGDEELREHIRWNIERAQQAAAGQQPHNAYHVW
ncbi:MAG: NAD(P)-dependent oxidoreductase [Oscillospiraceae bacterium]|jgi:UDP-glucose 4-epimerase|nr:NAD(P)-dependent oxidoreductase [Oscillospiraceae bacterium]